MTAPIVGTGSTLTCSVGAAPSVLTVTPKAMVDRVAMAAANVGDQVPMAEVQPFGMCSSLANPTVASATSAANGVLTPMPCVPNIPAPWTPGNPLVLVGGLPVVTQTSTCTCAWGGVITVTQAGQTTVVA
jgi:hypothetical protein